MDEIKKEKIREQIRAYKDDSALLWQLFGWYGNRLESSNPDLVREAIDFFKTLDLLSRS